MNISGSNRDPKAGHPALGVYSLHTVSGIPPAAVNLSLCVMYAACLDFAFPCNSLRTLP